MKRLGINFKIVGHQNKLVSLPFFPEVFFKAPSMPQLLRKHTQGELEAWTQRGMQAQPAACLMESQLKFSALGKTCLAPEQKLVFRVAQEAGVGSVGCRTCTRPLGLLLGAVLLCCAGVESLMCLQLSTQGQLVPAACPAWHCAGITCAFHTTPRASQAP